MNVAAALAAATVLAVTMSGLAQSGAPLAYVSCERGGQIAVIDTATDRVVATIRTGHRPRGLQIANGRLFVALSDPREVRRQTSGDAVVAFDLATNRIAGRFDGGSDPERFAVTRDGGLLYAANEDAGTATITDTAARRILATVIVGIEPEGVAISPDERWVYVTAETSNTVSVIDTQKKAVVSSFMVDPRPRAVAFSPSGTRAYVTSEIGGTVSVIDVARHRVIETLELPQPAKPVGVAVSPDGTRVYVANGHGHSVAEIDAASNRVARTFRAGQRPWGIAVTPDGGKVYTANGLSNDVSAIDLKTGSTKAISACLGPWDVVVGSSPAPGSSTPRLR